MLKEDYLKNKVEHIDFKEFDSTPLIEAMSKMSFSAREIANAANLYKMMLEEKDCSIFLTLAGSTTAAGCKKIYADMVKYNMVDVIVATGASIIDMDFFEALGFNHYKGSQFADDSKLRDLFIDRIYDTYINEKELQICDITIKEIADTLECKPYSSREFIYEIGKWLSQGNAKKKDSLIELAYKNNVPIFCPAFTDSSAGFGLVKHQFERKKENKKYITIDSIADFSELTQIKIKSQESGIFIIGGGVPKNFTQDVVICAEILGFDVPKHKYAVQITVADARDGSCSSSTLKEASSWGKVNNNLEQMVYAEATIVLPLITSYAYHNKFWANRKNFAWNKIF